MTIVQQQAYLDQRASHLARLLERAPESLQQELRERIDLSWIHHESALEGVVYSLEELVAALRGGAPEDPLLASSFDEIRQSKAAIDLVRAWAAEKRSKVDAEVIKDIYVILAPDEVDGKKPPAYRKDIPVHRLYFHEIAAPDKIAPKLKALAQWVNSPETRRSTHVLRLAARAHFHLLHIYPYPKHSGKIARLVMNLLLLSAGYPPAVIHSTERQRYYDALKTNENALAQIVKEALTASIDSSIRFLEARLPPPAPPPVKKARPTRRRRASEPAEAPPPPAATPSSPRIVGPPLLGTRASSAVMPMAMAARLGVSLPTARDAKPPAEERDRPNPGASSPTSPSASAAAEAPTHASDEPAEASAVAGEASEGRAASSKARSGSTTKRAKASSSRAGAARSTSKSSTQGNTEVVKVQPKPSPRGTKSTRVKPRPRRAA